MARKTMTCQCCGGDLPMWEVCCYIRERYADTLECTGSTSRNGACQGTTKKDWVLHEMAVLLIDHGHDGKDIALDASDWIYLGFDEIKDVDQWLNVGVWNPTVAAECRDAGIDSEQVASTCTPEEILECCQDESKVSHLIEAAQR